MATLKGKTRLSVVDKRVEYLGAGCELLEHDLPTLRACLRFFILLKDHTSVKHQEFDKTKTAKQVYEKTCSLYYKANASLIPPVLLSEHTFVQKLLRLWDEINIVVRGQKGCAKLKKKIESQLDKLFDLMVCQCPIVCVTILPCSVECTEHEKMIYIFQR